MGPGPAVADASDLNHPAWYGDGDDSGAARRPRRPCPPARLARTRRGRQRAPRLPRLRPQAWRHPTAAVDPRRAFERIATELEQPRRTTRRRGEPDPGASTPHDHHAHDPNSRSSPPLTARRPTPTLTETHARGHPRNPETVSLPAGPHHRRAATPAC